jgi:hypothetical protein
MPIQYATPLTISADSRLSDDVLLVAPVSVDPEATTGTGLAVRSDGTLCMLAIVAGAGAAELAPTTQSASGYTVRPLPSGAAATEIVTVADEQDVVHAFYTAGTAVLHSRRADDGTWSQPDTLAASTGLTIGAVPLTGDYVVSGSNADGNLVIYSTASDSGQWSAAVVDVGGALLGGNTVLQYTVPGAWVLFAAAGGKLSIWSGEGTAVASGPDSVSVAAPVARVLFTYLHANSAMVVFTDTNHALYSSVRFSDTPIALGSVVRGCGAIGPDNLIRLYGCDPDGTMWVLRQTGWATDDSPVWAPIFPLDVNATDVTGPVNASGALLVTTAVGQIDLLAQPGGTGLWTRVPVHSDSPDVPLRTPRYRTRLTVTDSNGLACGGATVSLMPSGLVGLEVGGQSVIAAPDSPAVLTLDATGTVEFSQPATGLDAVTFTATTAGGAGPLPVTPYDYLHAALGGTGTVFTGSAQIPAMSQTTLLTASVDGQPLASNLTDPQTNDAKAQVAADGIISAIQVGNGTSRLAGFEIDFRGGKPRFVAYHTKEALSARQAEISASAADSPWDDIAQFGDDVWNAIKSGALAAVGWVVDTANKVVDITVQIADDIAATLKGLALAGIGAIVSFVHGIFDFIGAELQKLLDWLKDELDWASIWTTMDAFYGYLTTVVNGFAEWIESSATVATGHFFTDLKDQLNAALTQAASDLGDHSLDPSAGAAGPSRRRTAAGRLATAGPKAGPPGDGPPTQLPGSPAQQNWFLGKLLSYLSGASYLQPSGLADDAFTQLQTAVGGSRIPADAQEAFQQLQDFFGRWLSNPRSLLNAGAGNVLGVVQSVLDLVLDAADLLITLLLDLVGDVLQAIDNVLCSPLPDNPVLTWLWENVIRPSDSTDEPTLGRYACLALAAPVTLACIEATGSAPFAPAGRPGDDDSQVNAQYYTSLALMGIDIVNDLINAGSNADEFRARPGDGGTGGPALLWNFLDYVATIAVTSLFSPFENGPDQYDWSANSLGTNLSNGAWLGNFAPIVTDGFFLMVDADNARSGRETPAVLAQVNAALDCVQGLVLAGLGTAGASILLHDNDPDTTWVDVFEALVGPLPWAGQPLLLPEAVDPTEGATVVFQVVLDIVGDFDASDTPGAPRRPAAAGLTPEQIVQELTGQGVTQGWDVVVALTAGKVNELFQRSFVINMVSGSDLPPVNGTVPVIRNVSVEFVDVILGSPLIAFDPAVDPQQALLTIPLVSGLAHTVVTAGGTGTVVSTQWISAADGYTITGVVPLGAVDGDVSNTTDVSLQINDGTAFLGNLQMTGAAGTVLGEFFLSFLQQNATGFDYPLGTLSYQPNGTDLTPVKGFQIATQRDDTDPADAGRVLLFVPTTYNPDGGSQTMLPVANVVPDGSDVALLLSSEVLFGYVVSSAVAPAFPDGIAAGPNSTGAWSAYVGGGTLGAGGVSQPWGETDVYTSGGCSQDSPSEVLVPLAGITFGPSGTTDGSQILASWSGAWDQPWAHEILSSKFGECIPGSVPMTVTLHTVYAATVDQSTAEISFAAQNSLDITFPKSSIFDKIFTDGGAADAVAGLIRGAAQRALEAMFSFSLPEIGAFAVANLLFPDEQATQLDSVYVPGDLISFGTLQASALAVTPALATISTAEQLVFTASQPVTWSATAGSIDADGTYTPPASLARSLVVVITATATSPAARRDGDAATATPALAYAAVVVALAQVQVAPLISVFQAGDAPQAFTASLPGSTAAPAWSLSPDVGSVDANGNYTPPTDLAEPTPVTLTAQIGDAAGTAQIVVFPALPVGVAVTPNVTTPLAPGGSQAFAATLGTNPAEVDWTLLPAVGTIDTGGNYQAPGDIAAPTAALVVASSTVADNLGGIAVVLIAPASGWETGAIARPAIPAAARPARRRHPQPGQQSNHQSKEHQ